LHTTRNFIYSEKKDINQPKYYTVIMVSTPELKRYLGKELSLNLNGKRTIRGRLVGYDLFLNLNLQDCIQLVQIPKKRSQDEEQRMDLIKIGHCVVRGNSIESMVVVD